MIQFMEKMKTKGFLENYYFIEDIELFCNSDESHYDKKGINLLLKLRNKYKKFLKLWTLELPPKR